MRIAEVPIDMASEQKEILGFVSKRQLIYLVVSGLIIYSYVPLIYKLFSPLGWIVAGLISLISTAPTIGLTLYLGFTKVQKMNMNRDYYLYIFLQRGTQYGSWRKGH